jgi:hypothetical protein
LDVVELAVGDVDEGGDVAAQIEQGVQFHCPPCSGGSWPREHRQAQVDGGGVQRVDGIGQFDPEVFVHIEAPGDCDQGLGKLGVDAPVADLVRVGQRVSGDAPANAHVVELVVLGA